MRAQRRDNNEGPIRKRATALGFLWLENNASTKGRPDVCLLRKGSTYWCEVKVPGEPFTQAQMDAFAEMRRYGVPVYVLTEGRDVDRLSAGTLAPWTGEGVKVWSEAGGRKKQREHRSGVDKARYVAEMCTATGCTTSRRAGSHGCEKHRDEDAEVLPPPRTRRTLRQRAGGGRLQEDSMWTDICGFQRREPHEVSSMATTKKTTKRNAGKTATAGAKRMPVSPEGWARAINARERREPGFIAALTSMLTPTRVAQAMPRETPATH